MGFKKMDSSLGFADLALASSLKHNRSLKFTQSNMPFGHLLRNLTGRVEKLNTAIDWSRVETILSSHYTVGTSGEGADAYPPLMLFKCLLLRAMRPSLIRLFAPDPSQYR